MIADILNFFGFDWPIFINPGYGHFTWTPSRPEYIGNGWNFWRMYWLNKEFTYWCVTIWKPQNGPIGTAMIVLGLWVWLMYELITK